MDFTSSAHHTHSHFDDENCQSGPDYNAYLGRITRRPQRPLNFAHILFPGADEPRLSVPPTLAFEDAIAPAALEAPFDNLESLRIDTPVDGGNTYYSDSDSGAEFLSLFEFGSDSSYRSRHWNSSSDNDEGFTSIHDVNQAFTSPTNEVDPSTPPLPSEPDFSPPADFEPVPYCNVSLGFEKSYLPEAEGSSTASPELAIQLEPAPLPHSSVGVARRDRVQASTQGPYASARSAIRNDSSASSIPTASIPPKLTKDCPNPANYSPQEISPGKGMKLLRQTCPNIQENIYYQSDAHSCFITGCDANNEHTRFTRKELRVHLKMHPEFAAPGEGDFKICPLAGCKLLKLSDRRAWQKHLENLHWKPTVHVLCAFCLESYARAECVYLHFDKCPTLLRYREEVAAQRSLSL